MRISRKVAVYAVFALLLLISAAPSFAQTSQQKISTDAEIKEDLTAGPCKNAERVEAVKALFKKMGAGENDIKVDGHKDIQNVMITLPGSSADTIIVGAHLDKVSSGCGIIDNWSGIVILGHLYRTLKATELKKTYVFVAFDREEEGLKGSAAMAKNIPKESRAGYCSMVNLDSFGLGYPVVLENASDSKMTKFAKELATELKMPLNVITVDGASSDSASFNEKKIPAITLSALSPEWPRFLHSSNDKLENVNVQSVRVGYRYALEYINRLEVGACNLFSK